MSTADRLKAAFEDVVAAAESHAPKVLEPLLEYDKVHCGDLVRTLHVYLLTGCNASKAAEILYLHRSGLLYRLRRIEALLGIHLDEFHDRVALEVFLISRDFETGLLEGEEQ